MKHFRHFRRDDRLRLEALYNAGASASQIARILGFGRASIYREIKRGLYQHKNSDWTYCTKYSADLAQQKASYASTAKGPTIKIGNNRQFMTFIEDRILNYGDSPAAALSMVKDPPICLRTLYHYIYGGMFLRLNAQNLPFRGKRLKKKAPRRQAKRLSRGAGIEDRPKEVLTRADFGHWEMDTVIGKRAKGETLLVMTERKTRFEIVMRSPAKTSLATVTALDELERACGTAFPQIFKTITVDNGCEFQNFTGMERAHTGAPRTKVYYCHPFASGERGSNEKNNQMLRRKIPKGTRIETLTDEEIAAATAWLNHYPRRLFGYRSAADLFESELSKIGTKNFFEKILISY